jgi:hypothetical protein
MAKKHNDYDQYDDLQLLLRYAKLDDDDLKFFLEPRWYETKENPLPPDHAKKALAHAEKIDKIIIECFRRGLMGNENLTQEEREEAAEAGLKYLKEPKAPGSLSLFNGKHSPFGGDLTPKAKALKPWEHHDQFSNPEISGPAVALIFPQRPADHIEIKLQIDKPAEPAFEIGEHEEDNEDIKL